MYHIYVYIKAIWKDSTDESTGMCTWYCNFLDDKHGATTAATAIKKKDWEEFRLAKGAPRRIINSKMQPARKAFACEGDLPDEYFEFEVNMRLVRVVRRRHGQGQLHLPKLETYLGKWVEGRREGEGMSHSIEGNYIRFIY